MAPRKAAPTKAAPVRAQTARKAPAGAPRKRSAVTAPSAGTPEAPAKATRQRKATVWPCTREEIEAARDGRALSWRDVGVVLNIGSPTQARRAYRQLTGRAPATSHPEGQRRAKSGTARSGRLVDASAWDEHTDRQLVTDAILGHTILLKPLPGSTAEPEALGVAFVRRFTEGPKGGPAVEICEGYRRRNKDTGGWTLDMKRSTGATRTIAYSRILEVR